MGDARVGAFGAVVRNECSTRTGERALRGAQVLVVAGPAGVGKSTLARALGERLGWSVVDRDPIKSALLLEGVGLAVATVVADRRTVDAMVEGLREGSVIVDAPCVRPGFVAAVRDVAAWCGVRVRCVLCWTPPAVCARRRAGRAPLVSQVPATTVAMTPGRAEFAAIGPCAEVDLAQTLVDSVAQVAVFARA